MNDSHILSAHIIDRLLPNATLSIEEIEARYPARQLPEGAEVMRVAPSPTGFLHFGTLYAALVCQIMARQTGGVYYLRMEDTDRKREVEGSRELIMELLEGLHLLYDEGPIVGGDKGDYGPYTQSQRGDLYRAYVRRMLDLGRAYPCFMTPDELEVMAAQQIAQKLRPGYYGQWAQWRDKPEPEVLAALNAGKSFVIRFRSNGDVAQKITVIDRIKGSKDLPQNDNDIVILKTDGLPTYHMAHIVDDHLMHTTTVLRADEWFPSVTLHIQLAQAASVEPFTYAHISPIQKMDGSSRRKLSKRKDPEANGAMYEQQGYPVIAVIEYMLTLANSNFEDWRRDHPDLSYKEFPFRLEKMQKNAGALLNMQKLDDISRNYVAGLPTSTLFELASAWAVKFDPALYAALAADQAYAEKVFAIERAGGKRKDIGKFSDIAESYGYFFDELYAHIKDFVFDPVKKADVVAIVNAFLNSYNPQDDQDTWFTKLKQLGEELGFTPDTREYRQNPSAYKGSVAEVAMVLRVALTGRNRSPNLYDVMRVMGQERVVARLKRFI
ncbi:MAG TPA: glutamate--tRNA ligase family protein [Candidatus Saccharimonadales bacterium]|nr:glutamate--tRNA ligase family protein [Candidatus Saccharimonadales bacterium]